MPRNSSGPRIWTTVRKSADESVANNTAQNDDELFFPTVSGTVYEFEIVMIYTAGSATPDFKFLAGEDSTGTRGAMTVVAGVNTTDAAAQTGSARTNQTDAFGFGTATSGNRVAKAVGNHLGNGAIFRVLWAQVTTSAGNPVTVKAGSVLRYRVI